MASGGCSWCQWNSCGHMEVSYNGGTPHPSSHEWSWLSIEPHGDLGIPHFKKPSYYMTLGTQQLSSSEESSAVWPWRALYAPNAELRATKSGCILCGAATWDEKRWQIWWAKQFPLPKNNAAIFFLVCLEFRCYFQDGDPKAPKTPFQNMPTND